MAAIEGFELSISTDDVLVGMGMVNGTAVPAPVAALDTAGLADGTALVVVRAGASIIIDAGDRLASDICVGSATIASAKATAVSLAHRGSDAPASTGN